MQDPTSIEPHRADAFALTRGAIESPQLLPASRREPAPKMEAKMDSIERTIEVTGAPAAEIWRDWSAAEDARVRVELRIRSLLASEFGDQIPAMIDVETFRADGQHAELVAAYDEVEHLEARADELADALERAPATTMRDLVALIDCAFDHVTVDEHPDDRHRVTRLITVAAEFIPDMPIGTVRRMAQLGRISAEGEIAAAADVPVSRAEPRQGGIVALADRYWTLEKATHEAYIAVDDKKFAARRELPPKPEILGTFRDEAHINEHFDRYARSYGMEEAEDLRALALGEFRPWKEACDAIRARHDFSEAEKAYHRTEEARDEVLAMIEATAAVSIADVIAKLKVAADFDDHIALDTRPHGKLPGSMFDSALADLERLRR